MAARKRSFTPICPNCGSVRCVDDLDVSKIAGRPIIVCQDCGRRDRASKFDQTTAAWARRGNDHWRDGAALSMDGIGN